MPAYIIAFVDIHDRPRFDQEYLPTVASTMEPYGGRVIAASDEAETLESSVPPGHTVLIEFPDLDSARRWYNSDAYAPLLAIRLSTTASAAVMLPGGFTLRN